MSLLDPILINTGLFSATPEPGLGLEITANKSALFQNVILPLILLIILAFFLKQRYEQKKLREQHDALGMHPKLQKYFMSNNI